MNTQRTKRWLSLIAGCTLLFGLLSISGSSSRSAGVVAFPGTPLRFIENTGQFPEGARFLVYGPEQAQLWLAEDALWLALNGGAHSTALRLSFPGANPHPALEPFGPQGTVFNYYHGNDPSRWRQGVPVWSGVRYVGLFPGVDLVLGGQERGWDWRLACGAVCPFSLESTSLLVEGADSATVAQGALHLSTAAGPFALPLLSAEGSLPEGQPAITSLGGNSFTVAIPFASPPSAPQSSRPFSPQNDASDLLYGTFLGGDNDDEARGLAVDGDGAAYLTGRTKTPTFPTTPGAYDNALSGDKDIFVTKLNAAGSDLLYSTFIGGDETSGVQLETGYDIAVDGDGVAYLAGGTSAADFPTTPGAYAGTGTGFDNVVAKLDNSGGLAYATYLPGTTGNESAVAVDGDGKIYVTGTTGSEDMPTTPGAYDTTFAYSSDIFVVKLDPAGQGQNDLLYSTYVGMGAHDYAKEIALDESGVVHVIGQAEGAFPTTPGAYDTTFNGTCQGVPCPSNVIFFQLNPAGNGTADLLYATYLGGTATINERGEGITVDAAGIVYLTGSTWAADFPATPGAFDTTADGFFGDVFVSKLNPAGNGAADLLYSTFLSGWYIENGGYAIAVDSTGDIYVVGDTYSDDFPVTPDAFQTSLVDYTDLFVTRLRPQGAGAADLVYSTYLGGDYLDYGRSIVLGPGETVFVAGKTASADFPTTLGAYDTTYGGGDCSGFPCYDAYVAKLNVKPSYVITGTVTDLEGQPILGVQVSAGGGYQGTSNTSGEYAISNLEPGDYVLTPKRNGYFFSPASRAVTIPPSATEQNFTGVPILKESEPPAGVVVDYDQALTYTVWVALPNAQQMILYDPVPDYTAYISGTLAGPAGIVYDQATDSISGALDIVATTPVSVTFSVRVEVAGSQDFAPPIVNQACIYAPGGTIADCIWSNEVRHPTYEGYTYLPLIEK